MVNDGKFYNRFIYFVVHHFLEKMSESRTISNLFFLRKRETKAAAAKAQEASKEARLVERICAGEKDAFDELYKNLSPMVHGIILARVPRDEVDDIVQDVFISAYNNLHKLRDKKAVNSWVARIARNRAVEFYRRRKLYDELPENLSHKESAKAEASEILDVIREMPEAYKDNLIMRLVEGMTGPEIAEKTGLSHSSVRVNLHRGMRILRGRLGIKE